ncbi:RPEL repeat protein [Aureobasidium pullulans]|nr:RPEL repeat protein [Aureobasidium pullulans]
MSDELTSATTSPISLERRNSLEKAMQNRPEVHELREKHILLNTNAAPALQAQQQELQRHKLTDSLNKAIASRPEKDELVERNILPDSTAAPALQNHQRELAAAMRRDSIEKHLQTRPSPAELVKEGILEADENPLDGP